MPHQAALLPIGAPFIELPTVDSTNNYAMAQLQKGLANHGAAYFAHNQTAGKGQRGKSWTTAPQQNMILSVVLQPASLSTIDGFYLSAGMAAGCYEFFKKYAGEETSIKWPNDIYWRDRKAGGILIENVFRSDTWTHSIVGIGLNINQCLFPGHLMNPVSLKQITGNHYHPQQLAKELRVYLEAYYQKIHSDREQVLEYYNTNLYRLNKEVRLRKRNIVFATTLQGVTTAGKLLTKDSISREFDFGEVEWIL